MVLLKHRIVGLIRRQACNEQKFSYLTADEEDNYIVAQANAELERRWRIRE